MKNIIIKHAMALVAIVIAGTTLMSFGISKYHSAKNDEPIYKWYELVETPNSSASSQQLASSAPLPSPPQETHPSDCARKDNTGNFCAVVVEFEPDATNFTLSGTDLEDAINSNSKAVGIASNNSDVDEDEDGYSRKQPQPNN